MEAKTGIPVSSYACMETGRYNISLDNLFRILGALDADISEVWPFEVAGPGEDTRLYHLRIQQFRLNELVSLSGAEGGAVFSLVDGKCQVLLEEHLSDFLLDRLVLYLEDGIDYPHGHWFHRKHRGVALFVFLKAEKCPEYVTQLARRYLVVWSHIFDQP